MPSKWAKYTYIKSITHRKFKFAATIIHAPDIKLTKKIKFKNKTEVYSEVYIHKLVLE
jgi:hypothetical protein